ncbi:MAG: hypothetical protein WC766_06460 [Patescibacteria group bacterium]|jgi:hypothetical protein
MSNDTVKKALAIDVSVKTKKYGEGKIVKIDELGIGSTRHPVFHVRLLNDDVRHFVEGEITAI